MYTFSNTFNKLQTVITSFTNIFNYLIQLFFYQIYVVKGNYINTSVHKLLYNVLKKFVSKTLIVENNVNKSSNNYNYS